MFDIITIGSATRDIFIKSADFVEMNSNNISIFSELECLPLGAKIDVKNFVISTGGGATNAAVTFKCQGFKTAIIVKVGDDEIGSQIISRLKKEGLDTSLVKTEKNARSAESIILINNLGERTILVYRGDVGDIHWEDLNTDALGTAPWMHMFSLAGDVETAKKIVDFCKEKNIKIAWTPGAGEVKRGVDEFTTHILNNIDIIVLNKEEASYITGVMEDSLAALKALSSRMNNGIAAITDGAKGVMVSDGKNVYKAGIFKEKKIEDRTGAGDAFSSGFISAIISNNDIKEAIRFGSANATSVVEFVGAKEGILTKEKFMDERWKNLDIEVSNL